MVPELKNGWCRRRFGQHYTVFCRYCAGHRCVQIGIIEYNKRRIAAQFHTGFLIVGAHCASNCAPTSVLPVKENLRTYGLAVSSPPMALLEPVITLHTRLVTRRAPPARRSLTLRIVFGSGGGGSCQCSLLLPSRASFTGNHRRREVPWGDGGEYANRFLLHNNALSRLVLRNGVGLPSSANYSIKDAA